MAASGGDRHRRCFIDLAHGGSRLTPDEAAVADSSVRVMSYNILAVASAESGFFSGEAEWLRFEGRAARVVREVADFAPSILCLQEADNVREFYGPALAKLHYDYVHVCRSGKADGEGVWYDRRRWFCRASQPVHFAELERVVAATDCRRAAGDYRTPNVAQIALLEALQPLEHEPPLLVVVSAHLWWKPSDGWLRAAQTRYLLRAVDRFVREQDARAAPCIFAGDFNSLPSSKVYAMLRARGLQSAYAFYPHDAQAVRQARTPKSARHTRSEDLAAAEAPFTSVNGARTETIDYIFYTADAFAVARLLDVPDVSAASQGLPNQHHPSDHIPIVADLSYPPR